jgi:hypothetical protein
LARENRSVSTSSPAPPAFSADELGVAEVWLYPDGSRILGLSTRCDSAEAFQVAAELRVYLAAHGVDLGGDQQTKTRKALAYFAGSAA